MFYPLQVKIQDIVHGHLHGQELADTFGQEPLEIKRNREIQSRFLLSIANLPCYPLIPLV